MLSRTVEMLNTQNQRQMKFSIEDKISNGGGTIVNIVVPLDYQFKV